MIDTKINIIDLRCPCGHEVRAKVHARPWATKCHGCGEDLHVRPMMQEKPNKVLFEFVVTVVPKPETRPELKAVAV